MPSLSAETNTYFVRILLTISPRMYREALALCIHRHRPDFDVLLAPPWSLDGRSERFGPHVLVQDAEEAGLPPALAGGRGMPRPGPQEAQPHRRHHRTVRDDLGAARCLPRGPVWGTGGGRETVAGGRQRVGPSPTVSRRVHPSRR